MRPEKVETIGEELAIRWSDRSETFISLRRLREHCPCAGCNGEKDVMGNVYRAAKKPLDERSFRVRNVESVGGYAIKPVWEDGHSTGLYAFDYLRRLGEASAGQF